MDNPAHLDPSQELSPPPEEKLLRAPTFWEKHGKWINTVLMTALIIELAILVIYFFVPTEMPGWLQEQACKTDAKLC